MHFSYEAPFYGRNVLDPDFRERAFMATYQDLGYYTKDVLTVLSPVRRVQQFRIRRHDGWEYDEIPLEGGGEEDVLREAQALYQRANLSY